MPAACTFMHLKTAARSSTRAPTLSLRNGAAATPNLWRVRVSARDDDRQRRARWRSTGAGGSAADRRAPQGSRAPAAAGGVTARVEPVARQAGRVTTWSKAARALRRPPTCTGGGGDDRQRAARRAARAARDQAPPAARAAFGYDGRRGAPASDWEPRPAPDYDRARRALGVSTAPPVSGVLDGQLRARRVSTARRSAEHTAIRPARGRLERQHRQGRQPRAAAGKRVRQTAGAGRMRVLNTSLVGIGALIRPSGPFALLATVSGARLRSRRRKV
jgi:hypothetical protein